MPGPALAEPRRVEEPVCLVLDGGLNVALRRLHERFDLGTRRRQADQVEVQAAHEDVRVGVRRGGQAFFLEPGQDEPIAGARGHAASRTAGGAAAPTGRHAQWLCFRCSRSKTFLTVVAALAAAGPGGAHRHPPRQVGDGGIGQFGALGHLQIDVLVPDRDDEPALFRIAGDDGRARVAPVEQAGTVVEQQSPLELGRLRRVAAVTVFDEDGTDFLLEELSGGRVGRWTVGLRAPPRRWRAEGRTPGPGNHGAASSQALESGSDRLAARRSLM